MAYAEYVRACEEEGGTPKTKREVEQAIMSAGFSRTVAKRIIALGFKRGTDPSYEDPGSDEEAAPVIADRVADLLTRAELIAR